MLCTEGDQNQGSSPLVLRRSGERKSGKRKVDKDFGRKSRLRGRFSIPLMA